MAWGRPAANYLGSWGIKEEQIYYCAQAVDNAFWVEETKKYEKSELRREFGIQGRAFLAVGRLLPRKGFDLLLRAWAALPEPIQRSNTLVIVGAGPEDASLRALSRSLNIRNIHFVGACHSLELAKYYAAADVFVFPSLVDVWGLVVNESLASGVPVLASRHAGASQELISSSGAGEVFDPLNLEEFSHLLLRWCTNAPEISRRRLQDYISGFDFRVAVDSFQRLVSNFVRRAR
ncbi:glycosyltransferase [Methylocaldum sp. GT1BB]|uniref:glycosyltransferase n=1 Tax=Methylocaldum sp. GT1BB TaxID=3438963 RepID=UPI003DA1AA6A